MTESSLWHDAFYLFVKLNDTECLAEQLLDCAQKAGVLGSILLAEEGINGMLAGSKVQLQVVWDFFRADTRFADMTRKRTACSFMPFKRLKVKIKDELVPLSQTVDATQHTGINVSPAEWRELLKRDDLVLIDNRNAFEYQLGHFKTAINPGVESFRDFADYLTEQLPSWQNRPVAMYCTGGIRCEKTTAWMKSLGIDMYQLEGGILNYFAQIADADEDYTGYCFVFDERRVLTTKLEEDPEFTAKSPLD